MEHLGLHALSVLCFLQYAQHTVRMYYDSALPSLLLIGTSPSSSVMACCFHCPNPPGGPSAAEPWYA